MSQLMITTADAKRAMAAAHAAGNRLKHLREKGEEITESVFRTLETTGAGFALGVIGGAGVFANGDLPFINIPVELGAGILAHGLRLMGVGGKHSDHLANFGDGALTSYFHVLGRGLGAKNWGKAKTSGEMSGNLAERLAQIAA
jgi:hypothetical protein